MTEIELYLADIDISQGPGFCNPWTGGYFTDGYPRFHRPAPIGMDVRAARFGWTLLRGPLSPELCVCHTCDWPPCMNPMHWFAGTRAVNLADMRAKGRHAHGSRSSFAKLTEADVRVIRYELLPLVPTGRDWKRRGRGALTMQDIADHYGVVVGTIEAIRYGLSWRHI